MSEDLEQFRARLNGAAAATYVLVMLVVPLKLWCRFTQASWRNLGLDDYLCILALACANAFFYLCILGMGPYLARHVLTDVKLDEVIEFLQYLFAGQILSVITLTTIKYTILAFYWRLFSVRARIPILIGVFIVTAWMLSIIFLVIFTCSPIQAQWDITTTNSKCISLGVVYIAGSTPNVVTDLIILALPIPYVLKLHAPLGQRLVLAGMFMLGCFVSIVSVVRLTILVGIPLGSSDVTYNTKEVIVWSVVEINIGLVSACLPSMKQALRLLGLRRLVSSTSSSLSAGGGSDEDTTPSIPKPMLLFPPAIDGQRLRAQRNSVPAALFSSLAGLSRLDEEEDSFQMINKTHELRGKTESNIQSSRRPGDWSDDEFDPRDAEHSRDGGIKIERKWSVLVDEKGALD